MASKAIVDYAEQLYNALLERSTLEKFGEKELPVFRGRAIEVYATLGISQGYYTPVWSILREQDCIDQLQRGARGIDTVILLNHPPDHAADLQNTYRKHLTKRQDLDTLSADVKAIKRMLGGLDIREALVNIEKRLRVLEAEREDK